MLIKYKGGLYTLRDVCAMMKLNYDDFMAWCRKFALQNYYKRTLKHGKK